ncbi:MAG TPA: hypothetical protein VL095_07970 [Flavisolibacter sp.]|nr:hypothetical protein [Flavisolibacter sp.]
MKRTLELVSFVSFVSFVMGIVLMNVEIPKKRSVDKTAEKRSSKNVSSSNTAAIYKAG